MQSSDAKRAARRLTYVPYVIAGSDATTASAEALARRRKQSRVAHEALDCFAEPVIGPRVARTRWLAMTGFALCSLN
jgi:hypothetical protein